MTTKDLAVTLLGQQTSMWCWAASGEMIMKYLGHDISQCAEANFRFSLTDCCNNPKPGPCVTGGWPQFSHWGFSASQTNWGTALTFAQLKAQIDANRPVGFSWGWSGGGGGGHMMVAIGYNDSPQMVHVNNPWPVNQGDYQIITYADYVSKSGNHVHWRDYYDISYTATGTVPGAADDGSPGHSDEVGSYDGSSEAAAAGLELLPRLVSENNYRSLRLSGNINDTASLSLGEPLPVQYIFANDIDAFEPGSDARKLLGEAEEFIFPVIEYGEVTSSIVVAQDNGRYIFRNFGNSNLITAINNVYKRHQAETGIHHKEYFLVHIPHVYHIFLAHYEEDTLMLTHIFELDEHGIQPGETYTAADMIDLLLPSIQHNIGALPPQGV